MKRKKFKKMKKINQTKVLRHRNYTILLICFAFFIALFYQLYNVMIINQEEYQKSLLVLGSKTVEGSSAPRGRIYDRNYKLLVDNKAVPTILYVKPKKVSAIEEIELAKKLINKIEFSNAKITDSILKDYYMVKYSDIVKNKITEEEQEKLKTRKLNSQDIENLKRMRINEEELNNLTEEERKTAYIYYLMNKGYSYDEKVIKQDATDREYAYILEHLDEYPGFDVRLGWERVYPYGNTFRTILGNVSKEEQGLPEEKADYYLKRGYSLNDRVGTSYLEEQYEELLKGKKDVYKVIDSRTKTLIESGHAGSDIVLTIDIDLQIAVENIMKEEMIKTIGQPNTQYYNKNFVVIQDPNNGEILAMSGLQIFKSNNGYEVIDYTTGILTNPMTVGSVVKGASMLTGYQQGAIKIGEYLTDECMKIASTPIKCSWKSLGPINDLQALALSSNVYQFKTAIRVGGGAYTYNGPLEIKEEAFDIYRNMYHQFGLGIKTEIDLPVESLGYHGTSTLPGHLLDFVMGQYDTYTPIQLSQYISTLANGGTRYQPHLLKEVHEYSKGEEIGKLLYNADKKVLNTVDANSEYITRVREGFYQVVNASYGLGRGYFSSNLKASGKTGTSESFLDTNNDGVIDTPTTSTAFIGYAPSTNPKMSVVVTSPDVSIPNSRYNFLSLVTKRITKRVTDKFFEMYPL